MTLEKTTNESDQVTQVPFADLHSQYLSLKSEIDGAINDVIKKSAFVRGPYVDVFEENFASAIGVKHCVSCANGTDALYVAMKSLGVKTGDQVITTAQSWISTSETIAQAGGDVVFCDIDSETYTIDVTKIEELITDQTVGIIPVHLYGQAADMDPILKLAKKHGLWIIEDCAQAHLATYKGKNVGTFGNAGTFSFYPGKNLGAMGDAGAIVTNDDDLCSNMSMFARHGGLKKGDHQIEGINSRMDGIQAAVLSIKLPHLAAWTKRRRELANNYIKQLSDNPDLILPKVSKMNEHSWHLYVLQHENRDELAKYLKEKGIQTVINYPRALPFLPAYKKLGHIEQDFPVAFHSQSRILSIPIFAEMSDAQLDYVANTLNDFSTT